ncbi:ANTAR domain-containing protein [Pseudarthrobacter sp. So.54]
MLVPDVADTVRWEHYATTVSGEGIVSVLAVPIATGPGAAAALNCYARSKGIFDPATVTGVERHAASISRILRLALRVHPPEIYPGHLRSALKSRAIVDAAVALIMVQNRCSRDRAMERLHVAARATDTTVHSIAADILQGRPSRQPMPRHKMEEAAALSVRGGNLGAGMQDDHAISAARPKVATDGTLLDLVLESTDADSGVQDFLAALASLAAKEMSQPKRKVTCGITLTRPKQPSLDSGSTGAGSASILQGLLVLDGGDSAAVRLFSVPAAAFAPDEVAQARQFFADASRALRLALRFSRLRESRGDIAAAMQSRTPIDLAIGAIMAQNRCTREAAFKILRNTSNNRNRKIRDVAAAVVASIAGDTDITARFEA